MSHCSEDSPNKEYDLQKALDSYTPMRDPRDPSVRDVLARLDEIEAKLDELTKNGLTVDESTAAALGVIQLAAATWLQNKTDHA